MTKKHLSPIDYTLDILEKEKTDPNSVIGNRVAVETMYAYVCDALEDKYSSGNYPLQNSHFRQLSNTIVRSLAGYFEPNDDLCYVKALAMTSEDEIWKWRNVGIKAHKSIMIVKRFCINELNRMGAETDGIFSKAGGRMSAS